MRLSMANLIPLLGRASLLVLITALAPVTLPAPAFMKLGDIKGEATQQAHKGWSDALSLSTFVAIQVSSLDRTTSLPYFGDLSVVKYLDAATPKLMQACASGEILAGAELDVTRLTSSGEPVYFKYRLKNVLVTSVQTGGSGGEDRLTESVSLNYNGIDVYYWQLDSTGKVVYHAESYWDILTNKGGSSSGGGGNTAPSINPIAEQAVLPGEERMVTVVVSDLETPADSLEVTATTTNAELVKNLSVSGTGSERTLTFSASSLYSGSASVTVFVSDGALSRSTSFTVLINVEMTPWESFLAAYFSPEELLDVSLSSPIGDPDRDDLATVMEFALGTNPREFTHPEEAVRVRRENTPDGAVIHLEFNRRTDAGKLGPVPWMAPESLQYSPYKSGNPLYNENTQETSNPLYEQVSATIILNPEEADTHFIRMGVSLD